MLYIIQGFVYTPTSADTDFVGKPQDRPEEFCGSKNILAVDFHLCAC